MQGRQNWHDTFDTMLGLHRWYQTEVGHRWLQAAWREASEPLRPESREMLAQVYASEASRLGQTTPYFVSREMCELVEVASETFQPEPVYPTDVLTPSGFLMFERPFTIPSRFDEPVDLVGFSWQPYLDRRDLVSEDRPLTREDEMMEWLEDRHKKGLMDGVAVTLYQPSSAEQREKMPGVGSMLPLHCTPWWWGMTFDGNEIDENGLATGAGWWWRLLQTTLRLMVQKISVRHIERLPRPQRREAKRYGIPIDETVVVRLRREKTPLPADHVPEPANYSHRFIRSGHWRNQPYPKEGVYRQIWIAPMVIGDESLPLIIKPRAYNWHR